MCTCHHRRYYILMIQQLDFHHNYDLRSNNKTTIPHYSVSTLKSSRLPFAIAHKSGILIAISHHSSSPRE